MNDNSRTKKQLIEELIRLRRQVSVFQKSQARQNGKVEKETSQALSLLKATLESTTDGILVVDNEGKITSFNKKFVEMWHIPESIIDSRDDNQALSFVLSQLKEPEGFLSKVRELYARPDAESFDTIEFKDGKTFERYSKPQKMGRTSVGRVWSFRDITERKKAEGALKKAKHDIEVWNKELKKRVEEKTEELEKSRDRLIQSEKLSAMGRLSASLAHEMNSPLAGILPLLKKYRGKLQKDQEAYREMTLMLNAAEHMAKIVRDFGSFARMSEVQTVRLNLNEVIKSTLSFTTNQLMKKGIRIIRQYADALLETEGDRVQLQQVVLNMVTNAGDAMPRGGTLTVKTGVSDDKSKVKMKFIDSGAGIEKENIGKIFDPFFTTKGPGKGIGLGLSISYAIIKNHKGEISVESKPGEGTTFTVLLPALT